MKWFGNCAKEELVFFVSQQQIAQRDLQQLQLGRLSRRGCGVILNSDCEEENDSKTVMDHMV